MADSPVDLTLERLNRLESIVEKRFDEMASRFDGLESALGKMVTVLEAHDQRLELLVQRVDRLIDQSLRSRTEDASRMADVERRLRELELRQH